MDKQPFEKKQDEVTRDDGDVSPPATPRAGTGPIGGSSAVLPGAGGGDSSPPPPPAGSPKGGGEGGESMEPLSAQGKQPALTGGSSTTAAGSPPPPSESLEGVQAEGEGLKKKRKKVAFEGPELPKPCSICSRPFSSWKALFGHMRSHKDRQWRGVFPPPISPPKEQEHDEQAEELTSTLLNIGQRILAETEENEIEGDGSAVAEGSASSSEAQARRKKFHMELDLNKEAPEDSDKEGGGDNDGA
ncbi:uncharacterized protein LOC115683646 [Syzygium oleosum]|uniref:uncharacterized protein LOC115683646 n=1 Tax=Syzygium oleosum TaxID=219896 RepID=UPI0011D28FFC|nr:uncharacterized protein LOC115683646 [Syzygium oleosum]